MMYQTGLQICLLFVKLWPILSGPLQTAADPEAGPEGDEEVSGNIYPFKELYTGIKKYFLLRKLG